MHLPGRSSCSDESNWRPPLASPTKLAHSVLLTSGAMTAALNRLQKKGLIRRIRSGEDRRPMRCTLHRLR
ncbi:hypothetical protein CD351_08420 [Erythrobacter sp. KY5]|uniref:MarR family transcriptional regulator n=1 Tax=Erythrobacter sp. KY5 TaxID=2011159 RepID=UPI000DBF21CC|nr:hypothetical protein CD351_08420 [Erythrobacter sp. KY5]